LLAARRTQALKARYFLPSVCCRDAQSTIAFQRDYIARLTSQLRETRIRAGLSEPDDRDAAAAPDAGVLPPWVLDVESMHPLLQAYDARISVRAACEGLARSRRPGRKTSVASIAHVQRELYPNTRACRSWSKFGAA